MKSVRVPLIAAGAVLLVLAVSLVVALTPGFQTWAVRRALASHPRLQASVGRVAIDFGHVSLTNVRFERAGVRFTAPQVDGDLPVLRALWSKRILLRQLSADGWVIDASAATWRTDDQVTPETSEPAAGNSASRPAGSGAPATFAGFLRQLRLPGELTIDRAAGQGSLILPGGLGTVQIRVVGGGLAPDQEGKFKLTGEAAMKRRGVDRASFDAAVVVAMSSPREIGRLAIGAEASATGAAFVHPIRWHADFAAERTSQGETYALTVAKSNHPLLSVRADYPAPSRPVEGSWKIDIRDADLAVFSKVHALPTFTAAGEGTLSIDVAQPALHAVGRLDAAVSRLDAWSPRLSGIGPVKLVGDIDVAQRGDVTSVTKLRIAIGADAPVATVEALQPFEFNRKTRELAPSDPARDLLGIDLAALPLAWIRPFAPQLELAGQDVRGELVATPRGGGFFVGTKSALTMKGLRVAYGGRALLREVDVSLHASGDYTPRGWQTELNGVTAKSGAATILLLDAKAGQLAGEGQPIKATALITADLAGLATQPVGSLAAGLRRGEGTVEFVGSFGATRQIEAKIGLKNLAAAGVDHLPQVTATLRADVAAGGRATVSLPVTFERDGRKSDLLVSGQVSESGSTSTIDARLTSDELVVNDAKALAGLFAQPLALRTAGGAPVRPRWAGLSGTVALSLKHVVYSDAFEMRNVTGTLRVNNGSVELQNVRAGMPEEGQATINGHVARSGPKAATYIASGELGLENFSAQTFFRLAGFSGAPPIEGRFTAATRLKAEAPSLSALSEAATGTYDLTSRGGVLRVPINVGNLVENSGKLAMWIAAAGSSIGNTLASWAGRKEDYDEITSRSQAANELSKLLSTIAYDQLNMTLRRADPQATDVKEFTLISPDFRMKGSGRARHTPGRPTFEDELDVDVQVRARGRPAELMKYLGILEPKSDDLGYAACSIPVHVGGTIGRPEAPDFSNRLIARAVEKTGILERAGAKALDWINRLRGK